MIIFVKGIIKLKDINPIKKSFNDLPEDQYIKFVNKNFRNRRFSRVIFSNNRFESKKDTSFLQSSSQNRYLGGVNRKFYPIKPDVIKKMNKMVKNNIVFLIGNKKFEMGYHQIRITCGKDYVGYPVPEGWHKDGFDYVALINFSSKNIQGGISRIRDEIKQNEDVDSYSCFLNSGEFLLFSDKDFFHFTDPIIANKNKTKGYRDTLVITFKIL